MQATRWNMLWVFAGLCPSFLSSISLPRRYQHLNILRPFLLSNSITATLLGLFRRSFLGCAIAAAWQRFSRGMNYVEHNCSARCCIQSNLDNWVALASIISTLILGPTALLTTRVFSIVRTLDNYILREFLNVTSGKSHGSVGNWAE